ncbi:hypothetical protein LSCM1_03142 [Leishmania martiniquensis]|uniref:Uncharacterized protein n=1 Tax=Leishmania martiniquensis TaxID=1580590 RepID=A0A836GUV6_9TRYP|nr:hypothetical protein LSCM1_03142 [Leishmania martiniquensis]
MVREAAEFEDEDRKVRERVEAKNSLESIAYSLRNQINDKEKLGGKLSADDKNAIEEAVKEALDFVDESPNADREEYESAREKLQSVTNPIIQKVYQATGGADSTEADAMDDL